MSEEKEERGIKHPYTVGELYEVLDRKWLVFESYEMAEAATIQSIGMAYDHTGILAMIQQPGGRVTVLLPSAYFVVLDVHDCGVTFKLLAADGTIGYVSGNHWCFNPNYFKKI